MRTVPEIAKFELGFRLSYEDLAEIMELLFNKFIWSGADSKDNPQVCEMRRRCHAAAFNNILTLAGWSQKEFEDEVWSRVEKGKDDAAN
jgi:hypothetical protein